MVIFTDLEMPLSLKTWGATAMLFKSVTVKQDGKSVLETKNPVDLVEPTELLPRVLPGCHKTSAWSNERLECPMSHSRKSDKEET